ncbi:hypothetical protein [Catellatospora citrea]|uniref:Uncharacterized protein n=1 Tax=Catellatospora citrea TaxID=53366 RepID=A0A8J3KNH5_9ACTN|nr:hypothetical protein [Catellatospora citrea]RKE10665.1 hypothetical protein C8E86_5581 [Catellatospora citrea]GIG03082.1 hypothetical protein Cci01nite_81750 [Catellatospora citrea]
MTQPAPKPIVIDDAFIHEVIIELLAITDQIRAAKGGGSGSSSLQTLENILISSGADGFGPGKDLRAAVNTRGKELAQRMDAVGVRLEQFAYGLLELLDHTDSIDDLAHMKLSDFERYVDLTPSPSSPTGVPAAPASP